MKISTSEITNHGCKQIRRWWQEREETTDATKKAVLWQLIRNRLEVNMGMDLLNRRREDSAVTIDFAERIVRWVKQREHVELALKRVLWGGGDGAIEMYITSPAEA